MLTLFHAPNSRSSAIVSLIDDMGITDWVKTRIVDIPRQNGSGRRDPVNPHPEGKVPVLVHDGQVITERGAIILHLTTMFPDSGLSPAVGTPEWGAYVSWLSWYQGVMEPVLVLDYAQLSHPALTATFRGHAEVTARLSAALQKGPWLLGDHYSAADLLVHSPYAWFSDATPDDPLIRNWVDRCKSRPARLRTIEGDREMMEKLVA